jgi:cytochrome c553
MINRWLLCLFVALFITFENVKANEFNLEETVQLCATCHGESGLPEDRQMPIIWGQTWYYIYVQLRDYKAGRRANEIMSGIVADLDKENMKALATYFSEKQWPDAQLQLDETAIQQGERHTVAGQCSQCHSTYKGDSRVPRLAGQYSEYLTKTMLDFKNKIRLNSPAKGSLLASYLDDDLKKISQYLANLRVR